MILDVAGRKYARDVGTGAVLGDQVAIRVHIQLAAKNLRIGVRIRNLETDKLSTLPAEGLFIAIGHDPNTKVFRGKLDMDANGYLITKNGTRTNVPGVFAAGDVQDHRYRQAVTAAGSGCMAAMDAEKFLEARKD